MSIKIMAGVWEHAQYDGKKLLILLAMADFADDEGLCWPSQETLADKARCSVEYVRTATKAMVEAGDLEIVEDAKSHRSRRYRLTPNLLGENDLPPNLTVVSPKSNGALPPNPTVVSPKSAWGEPLEPSKELEPLEPSDRFEEFWHAYALPKGKAEARKAWAKAIKDTDPQVIISAAREYVLWLDTQDDPPQQKYAQGWLNGRRWEDELRPQRTKKSNVTRLIDLFAAEEQKGIEG